MLRINTTNLAIFFKHSLVTHGFKNTFLLSDQKTSHKIPDENSNALASLEWLRMSPSYGRHSFTLCHNQEMNEQVISSDFIALEWLIHWSWVIDKCVSKLTIIGSDNGLSPGRHQAIIWTYAGISLIWTLGTKFSQILNEIHHYSFRKLIWKFHLFNGGHFASATLC